MNAHIDEHEPSGLHRLDCAIWTTTSEPCDCKTTSPEIPHLSTAERLDLIHSAGDPFEEVAS